MNLKQREIRVLHCDHIRARALHDLTRLREAVHQITKLAECPACPDTLAEIARVARNALIASTPAEADHSHDTDHS
ncbi:hypothetical protein WK39_27825 [Burkholderia cepacia]|uniref:hypothetical protein n=1 Tax=Burkholderia cepacia complex TaxID=87882 RepID=UPI00075C4444|nr:MULTISPECIES: hypothetical protein [Burkholderia cepacia complex]KVS50673.1 hypothetical protein WK39_27825 [Burkholderia cepacia]KVS65699.1 hypothetical protein WK40_12135 [Burkholderia cepacia]KWO64660.1 hypothetical protein WT98_27030 [Burkholderia territorii]